MRKLIVIFSIISYCGYAQDEIKVYEIKNISANNKHSNYGATYYGANKIVYTSSENGNLYDLFVGEIIDGDVKRPRIFSRGSNSNTHQSNVALTNDQKTAYFTRSLYGVQAKKARKRKRAAIALFKATITANGVWTNIESMPFNNEAYDVGHPTLNKDNTKNCTLVSNMPGTIGKSDIFEVDILPDGTYSEPRNLGPNVNTPGHELHPFISGDDNLYFSSNGHKGNLGGLDIYSVQITSNGITPAKHLHEPVNSYADDFSYILNSTTREGFFSSNRSGGKGGDDIYFFREKIEKPDPIIKEEKCIQKVKGTVFVTGTNKIIPFADVILKDEKDNVLTKFYTKEKGSFFFELDCNTNYNLEAKKKGFNTFTQNIQTSGTSSVYQEDLFLHKSEKAKPSKIKLNTNEIGFNYNESKLYTRYTFQLDKAIILMLENPKLNIYIESHTDSRAEDEYNMKLTEDRIFAITEYLASKGISLKRIRGRAFGETMPVNKCVNGVKCTEEEYLKNRRTIFKLIE